MSNRTNKGSSWPADLGWLSDPGCGTLTRRQQWCETRAIVAGQAAMLPRAIAATLADTRLRQRPRLTPLTVAPDTEICVNATAVADAAYSTALRSHVLRCWHWASLIAGNEGIRFDPETLYCAALLHDIGLTTPYAPAPECGCFAVSSARSAAAMLGDWGAPNETMEVAAEAIARHFDASPPSNVATEGVLLHDAAFLDVAGVGVDRTTTGDRNAVLSTYPRTDFAAEFAAALKNEAKQRPQSRAALSHRLGAAMAVKLNPLEHQPFSHGTVMSAHDSTTFETNRQHAELSAGSMSYLDAGQGRAAVFIHGIGTNSLLWRHVISAVASPQRRCIAVDWPGHGHTPPADADVDAIQL